MKCTAFAGCRKLYLLVAPYSYPEENGATMQIIRAHASIAGYSLLARDTIRYRTYSPKLPLMAPS